MTSGPSALPGGLVISRVAQDDALPTENSENSDVFMCRTTDTEDMVDAATSVTLFVFGWHSVEPGQLSWAFPSLRAALAAVRTMKNAVRWAIVAGRESDLEEARAHGTVLLEELG